MITAPCLLWIVDHASPYKVKQLPASSREWPEQACLYYRLGDGAALDQMLEIASASHKGDGERGWPGGDVLRIAHEDKP